MKLLLENWRKFVKQEVENYLPHGTVRSVEIIGSSNLSPEEQKQQDKEKYGFVQKNRDIDVEVQISGITSEESEEWAFSDEAQELEDLHNYDVQLRIVENWREYLKETDDFDWDAFGFSDEERGESIPNPPQYEDLISLDRGDTFTIGNRKPVYRIIGALGSSVGGVVKTAVIDGSAERKYYIIKPVGDDYAVGAFESVGGTMDSVDEPRGGKTGFVMNITKASEDL